MRSLPLILMMQLTCTTIFSQECGDASINDAQNMYADGRFDESISTLTNCLYNKQGYNFDQKIQAYHLLALNYLAIDSIKNADNSIQELLALKDNFEPAFGDPERFSKELMLLKSKVKEVTISSVSKKSEDIRTAPATAVIITQEEILQRGYTDIIDFLKDLPAFDISVYYGQTYANIYQRGLRTNYTEKTLILIDGVEDNDLWTHIADISQQYPITNIKRIEVIYGPASTMYGPNAFSGVINIITKKTDEYIKNENVIGIHANAGIGSYNSRYIDASIAFKKGIFSMSVTARIYHSERPNLSSQPWWDYDPSVYDTINYINILSVTKDAANYFKTYHLSLRSSLYTIDSSSGTPIIALTSKGDSLARSLDKAAYNQSLQGVNVNKWQNSARASYINAKINIGDLNLGFVSWDKTEGSGTSYTDEFAAVSGTEWHPSHKYIYASYNKPISSKLLFSAFLNYRIHTIQNGSKISYLNCYATHGLQLKDLNDSMPSYFAPIYFYEQSAQFRSEFKVLYTQSKNFYIVGGVELRNSQLQGYLLTSSDPKPEESGTYTDTLPGGNELNVNDIGMYAQGQYRTKNKIGFTVGARIDYDKVRVIGGLGYTFSPRVVIDKMYKTWVIKGIFCKGIEDVSNLVRFSDFGGNLIGNPNLKAESIYNYEISVSNKISRSFIADIDFYYSNVKNGTRSILIGRGERQIQNIAEYKILGMQSNVYYNSKNLQASISYSYASPWETKDTFSLNNGHLRIASIASNKIDAIVNYIFLKHYNINFRANYVSSKKAGPNTTSQFNEIHSFPGYFLGNIALSVNDVFKVKGTTLQLLCNNIFNKTYYSPGVIGGGGVVSPGSFLQMGRNFYFKINYEF